MFIKLFLKLLRIANRDMAEVSLYGIGYTKFCGSEESKISFQAFKFSFTWFRRSLSSWIPPSAWFLRSRSRPSSSQLLSGSHWGAGLASVSFPGVNVNSANLTGKYWSFYLYINLSSSRANGPRKFLPANHRWAFSRLVSLSGHKPWFAKTNLRSPNWANEVDKLSEIWSKIYRTWNFFSILLNFLYQRLITSVGF